MVVISTNQAFPEHVAFAETLQRRREDFFFAPATHGRLLHTYSSTVCRCKLSSKRLCDSLHTERAARASVTIFMHYVRILILLPCPRAMCYYVILECVRCYTFFSLAYVLLVTYGLYTWEKACRCIRIYVRIYILPVHSRYVVVHDEVRKWSVCHMCIIGIHVGGSGTWWG